jgi:hypothetical protein
VAFYLTLSLGEAVVADSGPVVITYESRDGSRARLKIEAESDVKIEHKRPNVQVHAAKGLNPK